MNEPARRRRAVRVNFLVTGFDFRHLLLAYLGIMQGCCPVRAALENGQVLRLFGDLRDRLDGGRAGADDADALAGEIHRRVRPPRRVIGRALETVPARNRRQRIGREDADGGEQEPRNCPLPAFQGHVPPVRRLIPMRGRDRAAELDVPAQVELVGDVIQVFERVGLRGEVLLPVPFRHQLLGKGVAIGPAFGIETRAGITVPVPGAADVRAGLEDPCGQAQFAQAVEHIHAGNPGADDDRVVDRKLALALAGAFRQGVCVRHDRFPSLRRATKIRGRATGGSIAEASYRFSDRRPG